MSVHDIAPSTRAIAEENDRGIGATPALRPCSLLVVPNYPITARDPIAADRELQIWLRELEGRGHEIVIHPDISTSDRAARLETAREKLLTRFTQMMKANFSISHTTMRWNRITRAREEFHSLGWHRAVSLRRHGS